MTSNRYSAHTDRTNPNRIICVDSLSENHAVYEFTPEFDEALIAHAQAFLDAGIARYGSAETFDRACRWYLELEKVA